jgi:AcrR family transcriptional regulator
MQRSNMTDRRVQKTEALLRDALTGLIREKPYDSIVVKEILDRANVGRTTFYTHFRDKDELLASSIQEMLRPASSRSPSSAKRYDTIISFSLPVFEYLQQHRIQHHSRAYDAGMDLANRDVLHGHLREVLAERIRDDVERCLRGLREADRRIPSDLLIDYVASTFVLVLDWWVETGSPLTPQEVDTRFRALVLPTLITLLQS